MTEENKTETNLEQARQLTVLDRHDAREDKRISLMERDVEQVLRIREEQHQAWMQDVRHTKKHREEMQAIARDHAKSLASIAESLGTMAKAVAEKS
ncbi:MAG TPA: hypothetical protein VNN25_27005 [Thermoanaerobaculia bacterium]|nr:hypothetical protein [Thermoanaerobaculia bacterium]